MRYTILLAPLLFIACQQPDQQQSASAPVGEDTAIATYSSIQHSSFDSLRCTSYMISVGSRNTGFSCSACQHLGSALQDQVEIQMLGQYTSPVSYRMELRYLQQLLPMIAKRFPTDSLDCITLGRISDHPDLAAELSREYVARFGGPGHQHEGAANAFLDSSCVARDFNRLFATYAMHVRHVGVEKLSLSASTRNMLDKSAMETDTAQVPRLVLDGDIYVYLQK